MQFRTVLMMTLALIGVAGAKAQKTGTYIKSPAVQNPVPFGRALNYNYEPTAFSDYVVSPSGVCPVGAPKGPNNSCLVQRVWWCSDGPTGPGQIGDSIWYYEYPNVNVFAPQLQLGWNPSYGAIHNVACSPTVVRVNDGSYRMFYECATNPNLPVESNICAASSYDGYKWYVWDKKFESWGLWSDPAVVETPIIAAQSVGYGVGHPSAILNTNGDIQLFYWQQYNPRPGALVYVITPDGNHDVNGHLLPDDTEIPFQPTTELYPVHVYALDTQQGLGSYYLATFGAGQNVFPEGNYYVTSANGINFWSAPNPLTHATTPAPCAVSAPAVLTDVHGHISMGQTTQNAFVIFSSEGQFNAAAEYLLNPDPNNAFTKPNVSQCWSPPANPATPMTPPLSNFGPPDSYSPVPRPLWQLYAISGTFNWPQ